MSNNLRQGLAELQGLESNEGHATNNVKEIDFPIVFEENMVWGRSSVFMRKMRQDMGDPGNRHCFIMDVVVDV